MAINDKGLTLEVSKFNAAMREMASVLRGTATEQQVIDFEVSKILEKALEGTETATVGSIDKSQMARKWITINGKPTFINHRGQAIARAARAALKQSTIRKLAARGLAKRSWYALAEKLGFSIKAPGYVLRAEVAGHSSAENVNVSRQPRPSFYGVRITNASPVLRWAEGRQAFFAAVAGRRKFFEQNLARGVFNKLSTVAKKYRGLVVTGG